MPSVPPPLRKPDDQAVTGDENKDVWPNWREETSLKDYEGREIRVLFHRTEGSLSHRPEPAVFGDFDPKPHDPDPDVWPLEHLDPGTAPVEKLNKITKTFPEPHVKWVTDEYIERKYGHDPTSVQIDAEDVPQNKRPDGVRPGEKLTLHSPNSSLTITDDHLTCFNRLAQLWNGREVRGQHLVFDKCPDWETLFGDLNQDDLAGLFVDPTGNTSIAEAFPDHDWVETDSVFLNCQRILRKKVWYAPTLRARTLINNRDDLPDLRGDPKEGLRHRVTVGLSVLFEQLIAQNSSEIAEYDVWSYQQHSGRVIDVIAKRDDTVRFIEVITDHNNWELHRDTYEKLSNLRSEGQKPIVVFDSRQTAYKVLNHWHRAGCGELPLGPFESNPRIDWGREKIQEAYHDESVDWDVYDWLTTSKLWQNCLGPNGPGVDRGENPSYIW